MQKVLRGEAAAERDGVALDRVQYAWPLLAGLLWVAAREDRLSVCDFGGALGSTYVQHRAFLEGLNVAYSVVEQPTFVERGRAQFETDTLRFYATVRECLDACSCNVLLLSGVLPCIEAPYDTLDELLSVGFDYVIVDRTPVLDKGPDRVAVQHVPKSVYVASYPHWFLSQSKLVAHLTRGYRLVEAFDSFERWELHDTTSQARGFILERIGRPEGSGRRLAGST